MKKFALLFLTCCLGGAIVFSGCDTSPSTEQKEYTEENVDNTTNTLATTTTVQATTAPTTPTEPSDTPTEPSDTPVDTPTEGVSSLVTDAYYKKIEYTDHLNDRDVTLEYALPQICLDSPAVAAVNEEILATYQPIVDDELTAYEEGFSNICLSITYDWTVNGDVLSLIITSSLDWHSPDPYKVYNILIKDARPLTTNEMCDMTALDQATIKDMLGSYYFDLYSAIAPSDFGDFYYDQLEHTIADDNVAQAMIYLDENGDACVIGKVYSMAGADYYSYIIPVNDYVPNADYEAYISTH